MLLDIVCKTLRSLTYSVLVHSVGTCSDYPAKSTGTKFKLSIESILNFCLIIPDG